MTAHLKVLSALLLACYHKLCVYSLFVGLVPKICNLIKCKQALRSTCELLRPKIRNFMEAQRGVCKLMELHASYCKTACKLKRFKYS